MAQGMPDGAVACSGNENVMAVSVDGTLCSITAGYPDKPCVQVKVCAPGTASCQTVDNVLLDTGSYGLRIFRSALNGILPSVTTGLAECVTFVDGSGDWGPVQAADVYLGGEPKVTVPIQVIDATYGAGRIRVDADKSKMPPEMANEPE